MIVWEESSCNIWDKYDLIGLFVTWQFHTMGEKILAAVIRSAIMHKKL